MKKVKILTIVIIVSCVFTSGCKKEENSLTKSPVTILAVLLGNHANSKKFNVQIGNKINQVYMSFGNVCIICVDGKPEAMRNKENESMMAGCYSKEFLDNSRADYKYQEVWKREYLSPQISNLNKYIEECSPNNPEVDTLEALHSAVEALNEMESIIKDENDGNIVINKEIIVYDTGLCTTGSFNFLETENLELLTNDKKLDRDEIGQSKMNKLIDNLQESAELPELSDIMVTWYGLGEVAHPQPELSKLDVENLRYMWSEILNRANAVPSSVSNAKSDYFIQITGYEAVESEYLVTPVIWWEGVGNTENEEEVKIIEEEIGFVPNSTDYISIERAYQVLRPYAQNLLKYPEMKILLLGTTASYNGGSVELSTQRAEHVKNTLVELGVSEENIVAIGVGYHQDFCENDSPNGEFVEEIGKNNRSVSIFPLDSEKAQKALNGS